VAVEGIDPRRLVVVLVDPMHEGNVGAAARALRNLGIEDLRLVRGVSPGEEAARMACAGRDLLDRAMQFSSLEEAVADAAFVVGFVSPERRRDLPTADLSTVVSRIAQAARAGGVVALVFGKEDRGLTREEAARCGALASIPFPTPHATLNVAQAVLLAGYEILRPLPSVQPPAPLPSPGAHRPGARPATAAEREQVYAALEEALRDLGFDEIPRPALRERVIARLRALFERGGLDLYDAQMLRGLAVQIHRAVQPPDPSEVVPPESARGERDLDWPEQL
jgi:TrmH family RNA methyltransferase